MRGLKIIINTTNVSIGEPINVLTITYYLFFMKHFVKMLHLVSVKTESQQLTEELEKPNSTQAESYSIQHRLISAAICKA